MEVKHTLNALLFALLYVTGLGAYANGVSSQHENNQSNVYLSMGAKIGLNHLDIETRDRIDLVGQSQGLQLALGKEILPILSVEISANIWLSNLKGDEDANEHELIHDFHFSGASLGVNTLVYFSRNIGPYGKLGFHCWGGSGFSRFELWGDVGCSELVGAGFSSGGKFYEVSHIRFHEVNSWFFTVGSRI